MTTRPAVVRQSELLNQLVIDRGTMAELGHIQVLWMYPQAHRVLGFVCRSGFLGGKKTAFKLSQITAIGENSVLTKGAPEATDAEKVRQLESMIQAEIWTDTGNKIGKITDFLFNTQTGAVTQYLYVSNGWSGITGEYQITPPQIRSFGSGRVLVTEAIAQKLERYSEGIPQKLAKVKEQLQEDAAEELRSLSEQAEAVTEQTRERLQDLTEQAKERAQSLTDGFRSGFAHRARSRVQSLNEQVKERMERAKATSQILVEQVKERSQTLSEQVEEGIQTLTVQAREILDPDEESRPVDFDEDDWDFLDEDDSPDQPDQSNQSDQPTQTRAIDPIPAAEHTIESGGREVKPPVREPIEPLTADPIRDDDPATDDDDPWI